MIKEKGDLMNDLDRLKLKAFLDELTKYRARHTEFVSVYVPAGFNLNLVLDQLSSEQNTASNIKSATTRKNVIDALERMIQYLKKLDKTPKNGLAIFSGNVSASEGGSDVRVWAIEPPEKIDFRVYRCDKEFLIQPLQEMLEVKEKYGLVVMDKREVTIGILNGKSIKVIKHLESDIPGKARAGGQSAVRFARLREGAKKYFFKELAEAMKEQFYQNTDIKGILFGGPGPTKYDFLNSNYMNEDLNKMIIAVKDIGYTDESGLYELVNACSDVLSNEELMEEKKLMNRFLGMLAKNIDKVAYGLDDVYAALEQGRVETVLVSDKLDIDDVKKIEKLANQLGSQIEVISSETPEGNQLIQLGKVAAILRY